MLIRLDGASLVLREVIPVLFAAIIPICFGTMLGWPCVSYPLLVDPDRSPILITMDQTSLIAGFLFEGNVLGCLFSTTKLIPSKIAICLCLGTQTIGWIVMYFSQNLFWFLGSRFSIGVAHGYGQAQIKKFVKATCRPHVAKVINLYLPVCLSLGLLITFTVGAFVDFRNLSIYMSLIPFTALILFAITPTTTFKSSSDDMPKNVEANATSEQRKQLNIFQVIKDRDSWKGLFLILVIVFLQQYAGGPANLVYTQMIFAATGFRYPKIGAIIYAAVFVINTLISLKFSKRFKPKPNLILGTIICALAFTCMSLYYYFKDELLGRSELYVILPFVFLIVFNFFHTFSLGSVPFYILRKVVPQHSANIAGMVYLIQFSVSAVLSTKFFQMIFDRHGWHFAYVFFVSILIFGLLFTLIVKDFQPKHNNLPHVLKGVKTEQEQGRDNPGFNSSDDQFMTKL